MKTKNKRPPARPLWTPARVKGWLEHCPKSDGEESYVCRGWVVDGELYCAECVHRLVENNIALPPKARAKNPMRGAIFIALGTDCEGTCEGCGGELKS